MKRVLPAAVAAIVLVVVGSSCEHPAHYHPSLTCIRHHESDRGPYPHDNGYQAENPRSSASGAYQFIDGTWRSVLRSMGRGGEYSRAKYAPPFYQDMVALHLINSGGSSAWRGSGCF